MGYDAYDALLHHIFKKSRGYTWFKPTEENTSAGVCLRVESGHFRVFPYENPALQPFGEAVRLLNPAVAVKLRSAAVHAALNTVTEDAVALYVNINTRIQILDTMSQLPHADKEQCGAFIRDEHVLVVWSDDLDNVIPLCHDFEAKLIKLVWRSRPLTISSVAPSTTSLFTVPSSGSILTPSTGNLVTKEIPTEPTVVDREAPPPARKWGWAWKLSSKNASAPTADVEKGATGKGLRPVRLFAPIYGGLGAALSIFIIGNELTTLLEESVLDGDYIRFALLATAPLLLCVSLFFALQVITVITYLVGPVAQYHENSRYYSAVPPGPNKEVDACLPHITIELPVFKESLRHVIAPSVYTLKKAMQTYARQGGSSAIFVHDDGLQILGPTEQEERIAFYANHNIGWVARPPHSSAPDGFKRAGRFKKASNMNYGLALSLKLEKHLLALEAAGQEDRADDPLAPTLEDRAMELAVEEIYEESGKMWMPRACNGKALRMGDIILLVDSDTIVPEDCLRDAARELAESPEVAIIQHGSDVMQIAHHYFETGIAYFNRRINKCISMGCANGEVAPFVGHNAFLRWSAVQEAAFIDPADGREKMWSESNVSEDFDLALRLQLKGYSIRWATYSKGGFKEGVSLTVDDELNRWQKYSYGCNELIFNPLIDWWRRGPITKQLRVFLWSGAPVHYKITMLSYMFSYYGIAASAVLSIINYIILGFGLLPDGYYMKSFEIWLACTVLFHGANNIGFTLVEYRLGHRGLLSAFIENLTWIPFFFFFFGGLSIHLTVAVLAHLFSYNITWGATAKEVERSNFFIEAPRILKRFWFVFLLCFTMLIGMGVLSTNIVSVNWRVPADNWGVVLPLVVVAASHILFPIVLNPWLMIFSY